MGCMDIFDSLRHQYVHDFPVVSSFPERGSNRFYETTAPRSDRLFRRLFVGRRDHAPLTGSSVGRVHIVCPCRVCLTDSPWTSAAVISSIIIGAMFIGLFCLWEMKTKNPM